MRVLVAIDGSECADVAVDLVAAIAWPRHSTIEVVQAVSSGIAVFGGPWPPIPPVDSSAFDADIRRSAQRTLDAAAARLDAPGRSVETAIASGRAADVITALAHEHGADLVVVGSRGHGTLESMLLGSTSSEVVDRSSMPVLVARGRQLRRVVLGWDGSERAEQAADRLVEWGIFGGTEIHVVSVTDVKPPTWQDSSMLGEAAAAEAFTRASEPSRRQHEQMAHEMAARLSAAGLHSVAEARVGDPAEQLVHAAGVLEADLVVVGTHGRTGLTRLLMGSVARNVLHHARCSVLVVHAQLEDERPA